MITFTAGHRKYANALLDALDPEGRLVQHRIFRDCCYIASFATGCKYVKNLNILGRDLDRTVIVDNSLEAFGFQMENGILVRSWYGDRGDNELMRLIAALKGMVARGERAQDFIRSNFDNRSRFLSLRNI